MKKKIKLFSMFSGYGGAEFALQKANIPFKIVGYSEIDKFAIQCYEQNNYITRIFNKNNTISPIKQTLKNYGDVTKINPDNLPDFDLLTGGFPCQSFSIAGTGLGELDIRGTLFNDIIRIAEYKQPKYMLLENVKGLVSKKHKKTFNKILSELKRIGYYVKWVLLNSKDYGTPQNRERVFFICFKNPIDYSNWKILSKEDLKIVIKDILEKNIEKKYYLSKKALNSLFNKKHTFNSRRLITKKHSPTLLSRDYKDPKIIQLNNPMSDREQLLINNNQIRKLTPKEYFRLMGFFDDEINLKELSDTQKYKLAGNGWDINLVSKIFQEMFKNLI